MRLTARLALAAATMAMASVALVGCGEGGVVRVYEPGHPVAGRFISPYAYALYAQGAEAEARGDFPRAAHHFEAAAAADGPNAEVWTRIGAVRCRSADGVSQAEAAFARAKESDPSYEPLHRERSRCLLRLGRADEALAEARVALTLDPDRDETSIALADAAERAGQREEALRAVHALSLRRPESLEAARALEALSARLGLAALAERTGRRVAVLEARGADRTSPANGLAARTNDAPPGALEAIDGALLRDDEVEATRLARRARLGTAELSVRAAALGRARLARQAAELVIGADPADASAHIAAAVAADALGEPGAVERALSLPSKGLTAPSPLARLLLVELLDRRVGHEAALAYFGPPMPAPRPTDPLFDRTAERVRARLQENPTARRAARIP